jgi:hypothetical protein
MAIHWPFQLGYFGSSAARAPHAAAIRLAASANLQVELRYDMIGLLQFRKACLRRRTRW